MKKLIFSLAIFFLLTTISSCCGKKGCLPVQNIPNIYFKYIGYQPGYGDLDKTMAYIVLNSNNSIVDSVDVSSFNNYFFESFYTHELELVNLLEKSYILINTNVSSDTLSAFNFNIKHDKRGCNSCGKKTDIYTIQNFSFYHLDNQYFDGDTVIISK